MRPEEYTLTNDLCARLAACMEEAKRIDGTLVHAQAVALAPLGWINLMEEASAKLRELEERLDRMWQDHRWCGS